MPRAVADCRADALGRSQACGAVGRFVATFICYPCFKLKVLAQSKKGNIKELYDKEGVAGVYKGFWSEMARGITPGDSCEPAMVESYSYFDPCADDSFKCCNAEIQDA